MRRVCPDGHDSASQDYCDICGLPMVAASEQQAPAAPPPSPAGGSGSSGSSGSGGSGATGGSGGGSTQTCSHCGAVNPAANLFCESCGFDFTTGALPERIPLADGTYLAEPPPAKPAGSTPPAEPTKSDEPENSGKSGKSANGPASAVPREAPQAAAPPPAPMPRPATPPSPAPQTPASRGPSADAFVAGAYAPDGDLDVHVDRPANRPPSVASSSDWVVEVWIDPTWFALQEGEGEPPSPGPPDIVALRSTGAIVGRPSSARGVQPDIDVGTDTAVSRRHARLDTDGRRWWIEDLGSSNGTFVGGAAEAPPEKPIAANRRVEVDADDRIYVGAWTRLVVRRATDSDRRDLSS